MVNCRDALKTRLPWAFCAGPLAAALLNVPQGVPIAETTTIFKTERVKPDIAKSDFFMLD